MMAVSLIALPLLHAAAGASRKEALFVLSNQDDPDAAAAAKAYLKGLYAAPGGTPAAPEETLTLTAKVEKKYYAAQVVESGIQVRP